MWLCCLLQAITRKTRILDVNYNASNNELVRKQAQMRESSSGTISSSFAQNSSYLHQGLQQNVLQ
jgi:hypothetical protein